MEMSEIQIPKNKLKLFLKAFLDLDNLFNENYKEVKEKKIIIKESGYLMLCIYNYFCYNKCIVNI